MKNLSRMQKILIVAVMALALAVPVAIAQSSDAGAKHAGHFGERGMGGHGKRGGMMAFRKLGLTDAQKTQMKQIRESHSQSVKPIVDEIRAKRQEIRQANQGGAVNEALVTQKLTEIAPLEAKLQGERSRIHQEMLAVLTPDQKAKLDYRGRQRPPSRALGRAGFEQMIDKLKLSEEQRTQVGAIFDDARTELTQLRRESGPKFREVRERTDGRLQAVLTSEQWEEFQQMTKEARERRRPRMGRDRPH